METLNDMVGHGVASINMLVCEDKTNLLPAAYEELMIGYWPKCFGKKPKSWDKLPLIRKRFMSKKILCKDDITKALMKEITRVIPFQEINRYWIKKNHHFI